MGNLILFPILLNLIIIIFLGIKHWKITSLQRNRLFEIENEQGVIFISVLDLQFSNVLKKVRILDTENDKLKKDLESAEERLKQLDEYYR